MKGAGEDESRVEGDEGEKNDQPRLAALAGAPPFLPT
jgi:hypothetical protein